MKSFNDMESFDFLVYELAETQEKEVLNKLIDFFDDNCDHPEVMYSLVHAIETVPDEVYISLLIDKISIGLVQYPTWFECCN